MGSAGVEVTLEGHGQPNLSAFAAHNEDWELSKTATDQSTIRWMIRTFKPFISVETDKTWTAWLQQGVNHLTAHLGHIFTTSQTRGYILRAWRWVKVMFIPKPRKVNNTKAKAYHHISLSSVTLKSSSYCSFLHFPATAISGPNIVRTVSSNTLSLCPSLYLIPFTFVCFIFTK